LADVLSFLSGQIGILDWVYPRRRHLLTQAHRHSARRVLMTMADPIERVPPNGAWLWRTCGT
jgi:hypothetical protein